MVFNSGGNAPKVTLTKPTYTTEEETITTEQEIQSTTEPTTMPVSFANKDVAYSWALQNTYDNFNDYNENAGKHVYYCKKDVNNDGVPELITHTGNMDYVVYTFDNNNKLVQIGGVNLGSSALFFSNNPRYPGIFTFHVGGGLERYGYLSIKNNKLKDEDLWDEDYSGYYVENNERTERIVEYSNDKALIAESKKVYQEKQYVKSEEFKPDISLK
jgi:hypothetical protein